MMVFGLMTYVHQDVLLKFVKPEGLPLLQLFVLAGGLVTIIEWLVLIRGRRLAVDPNHVPLTAAQIRMMRKRVMPHLCAFCIYTVLATRYCSCHLYFRGHIRFPCPQ